jgi:dienelactone hydrolase
MSRLVFYAVLGRRFSAVNALKTEGTYDWPLVGRFARFGFTINVGIRGDVVLQQAAVKQPAPLRTFAEVKAEALARAERKVYPLIGLDPADVREALAAIATNDRDEWAAAWCAVGDRYAAADDWLRAWRVYSFARWPVPLSAGKRAAYRKAVDAFLNYARAQQLPLEVVRIPFEGGEIVGYLELPPGAAAAPVIVSIGGLDSRKEDLAERFAPLLAYGVGSLCFDMPGTGEAPIKIAPGAERMFSRAIDWLRTRAGVDPARIALYGGSFGGYWACKLAVTERERLIGVVAQAPPVHEAFSADFARGNFTNTEYLFELGDAMMSLYEGVENYDDYVRTLPEHSLVAQGFVGKATAPMLVIHGARDTQVPQSDIELWLRSGESPKEAWINPVGGHMGRDATTWRDPVIFAKVTTPWFLRVLGQAKGESA